MSYTLPASGLESDPQRAGPGRAAGEIAAARQTHLRIAWRRFRRHHVALAGLLILSVLTLGSIFAPLLTPYGVDQQDLFDQLAPPNAHHLLGTDNLGQDVWTRLLYGGRLSLSIGILAALLSTVIGVVVGAVAGFYGRVADLILMRIVDILLAVFPGAVLTIAILAVTFLGDGLRDALDPRTLR